MTANYFSPLVKGKPADLSRIKKGLHSSRDWLKTQIPAAPKNKTSALFGALNVAGSAVGVGSAAASAGVLGGTAGLILASPALAIGSAVAGLVLLGKDRYSNREAAHLAIQDYVWNLVDDCPPTKLDSSNVDAAADAALTLLADGKNQMKLMKGKYESAEKAAMAAAQRILSLKDLGARTDALKKECAAPNGAIFHYVRRCSHLGNYLQAPQIVTLALKEKFAPGTLRNTRQEDFFFGSEAAKATRAWFETFDKILMLSA